MLLDAKDCHLVLIDYQVKLLPSIFEHEFIVKNASILSRLAHLLSVPCILTEQVPEKLGLTIEPLRTDCLNQGACLLTKNTFSACAAGLLEKLDELGAQESVISQGHCGNVKSLPKHLQKKTPERNLILLAGMEAHICLLQTALDLLEEDKEVWVVVDACSSRTERNRDAAFDRLAGNGIELVTTEMVAFEWMKSIKHKAFKEVVDLIK